MKKHSKNPDTAELIGRIQEQLISIERKIDALLSRPKEAPKEHHEQRWNNRERHGGDFRERHFFKAVCSDCGNVCDLPFKPGPDRPVYCKECFSKRKSSGNLFKKKQETEPAQEPARKKKSFAVKRKRR